MGPKDEPLITKEDLVAAIERHFVLEMKEDLNEEIGKFLSLKREETRLDLPPRNHRISAQRSRRTRQNQNAAGSTEQNQASNGKGSNGNNTA